MKHLLYLNYNQIAMFAHKIVQNYYLIINFKTITNVGKQLPTNLRISCMRANGDFLLCPAYNYKGEGCVGCR